MLHQTSIIWRAFQYKCFLTLSLIRIFLKLSKTLETFPQFFDENKISIVQKCVNRIDNMPKEYHQIETLYLSNNNLTSLEGIEQFSNLKTLTLVNNDVNSFS